MKRVLGVIAAGLLAAAPVSMAFADHHLEAGTSAEVKVEGAAADVAVDAAVDAAATDEAAAPAVREFMLEGEMTLYVEGETAYTKDADGNHMPLAEGDHKLADGTTVTVTEGVVSGLPEEARSEEAPAEEAPAEEAPAAEEGAAEAPAEGAAD